MTGGDAETGFGADIGAGLAWTDRALGVEAAVHARGLLSHEAGGMREWGFAGSLAFDPGPDTERGPALTVSHTVGASATGRHGRAAARADRARRGRDRRLR